ncbi:hypothetical protein GL218_05783 [Daldinia childiae]|uniref:uncharacterized protein n=1 Tax=Daldinia childiae TaxID=326645 RepID=UPI00144788D3|nr:uncharacterized protein GL218_05783 [Daldinia childiae]KAF3058407.1 hypothetical protein GL218_05783 [Daldinia childiae]
MDPTAYGGHAQGSSSGGGSMTPSTMPTRPMGNMPGDGSMPVKLTPITGRVSRAKKGVPVHTCETCKPPKTFTRAEHLRRHQLSHKTPGFPCTYSGCEKAFHRADLLARHAQRHDHDDKGSSGGMSRPPSAGTLDDPSSGLSYMTHSHSSMGRDSGSRSGMPGPSDNSSGTSYPGGMQYQMGGQGSTSGGTSMSPSHHPGRGDSYQNSPNPGQNYMLSSGLINQTPSIGGSPVTVFLQVLFMLVTMVRPGHLLLRKVLTLPFGDRPQETQYEHSGSPGGGLEVATTAAFFGTAFSSTASNIDQALNLPVPFSDEQSFVDQQYHPYSSVPSAGTRQKGSTMLLGTLQGTAFLTANTLPPHVRNAIPKYLQAYWKSFDTLFPVVHRKSVKTAADEVLRCAMAAVGAQYLQGKDDRIRANELHEFAWKEVKTCTKWNLQIMQTIILCEFYARFRGRSVLRHPSESFQSLYSRMANHQIPDNFLFSNSTRNERWNEWIDNESRRRLFAACFVLDAHASVYYQQHVIQQFPMSTRPIPLIRPTEDLWAAQSPEAWEALLDTKLDAGPLNHTGETPTAEQVMNARYLDRAVASPQVFQQHKKRLQLWCGSPHANAAAGFAAKALLAFLDGSESRLEHARHLGLLGGVRVRANLLGTRIPLGRNAYSGSGSDCTSPHHDHDNANAGEREAMRWLKTVAAEDSALGARSRRESMGVISMVRRRLEDEAVGAKSRLLVDAVGTLKKIEERAGYKWF